MNVSILGCGWLGLPLAKSLREEGHSVKGSTTSKDKIDALSSRGVEPFLIVLDPDLNCEDCDTFWNSDLLILNIPPGRGNENVKEYHTAQVQSVIEQLRSSSISRVIFISSTSVYPDRPGIVEEDDAIAGRAGRPSGNALLEAEKLLLDEDSFSTTVIRFGGLYGYDRHPAKYLAGRNGLEKGNAPVNLIHRDDCIGIVRKVIEGDVENEIFNAVSDGHPPRKMYYRVAAERLGLQAPTFKTSDEKDYKVVSNRKLKEKLDYFFQHPNPLNLKSMAS